MPIVSFGPQRRRYKWQQWELELLSYLKQEGKPNRALAQTFGVPEVHLVETLKRRRLRRYFDWRAEKPTLLNLVQQGFSVKSIAGVYQVEEKEIYRVFHSHQIPVPSLWKELKAHADLTNLHLPGDLAERANARTRKHQRRH